MEADGKTQAQGGVDKPRAEAGRAGGGPSQPSGEPTLQTYPADPFVRDFCLRSCDAVTFCPLTNVCIPSGALARESLNQRSGHRRPAGWGLNSQASGGVTVGRFPFRGRPFRSGPRHPRPGIRLS